MHFTKYHGLGNDYLVIDPRIHNMNLTLDAIRLICDRHFGVGADGILYGPLEGGDNPRVRIFNPDGSEAEKSGNGLRIFAKYLYEKKYVNARSFSIDVSGGTVEAHIDDDRASRIRVKMGAVSFLSTEIPVKGEERQVVNEELEISGVPYRVTCLSIGNPHCVIAMEDVSEEKTRELGPHVENHEMFPNRIKCSFSKSSTGRLSKSGFGREAPDIRWLRAAAPALPPERLVNWA
ncbi:MAG: diaminopimelate epimerase [Planctomycetota bacterium]